MTDHQFQAKFWGTRGSVPVSGKDFQRYGGNTPCIEVRCGGHVMIFDAGSGILGAGQALLGEDVSEIDVFFSHCHYDHIIGLPFFKPIYNPATTVSFWSGHMHGRMTTSQMIKQFISPPFFPINIEICNATLRFCDFAAGAVLTPKPGITLKTFSLFHPGGCIGYRIEFMGKILALVFDIEHVPGELDPVALEMMKGADVVVYDSAFTESEMQRYRGFGHSTWEQGVRLMKAAEAKKLVLFHHAPGRTDGEMALLEKLAQEAFPDTIAAYDGLVIDFETEMEAPLSE
ncbi:MBL fold metallo-hydrolase [Rhizobium sp. SSA_523]|uniref:MBL fold metallo-hydrolase n=1 Tax=Rhizobium sp. SSA_523 TaxID=2952477 RepID=UPI0020902F60|nr:MBL fold metallo-hydrolase [Rhizobium sp. SSA_523]MCO5732475.1 MBL fold metallo-hydrolase [Rhizobium sp. SSA_523]WKC22383.1 MBL fold metallo-hydrolase [Rhizobium sp. SSA_523]